MLLPLACRNNDPVVQVKSDTGSTTHTPAVNAGGRAIARQHRYGNADWPDVTADDAQIGVKDFALIHVSLSLLVRCVRYWRSGHVHCQERHALFTGLEGKFKRRLKLPLNLRGLPAATRPTAQLKLDFTFAADIILDDQRRDAMLAHARVDQQISVHDATSAVTIIRLAARAATICGV
jgi:hypothetical protein